MQISFSAQQIADVLNGVVEGDPNVIVSNFSKIEEGKPGTLTFLANPKYSHFLYTTNASIVLINKNFDLEGEVNATLIRVENAYSSLAVLLEMTDKIQNPRKTGIEANSFVAESATIGENTYVGTFAYIAEKCVIGKHTQIHPQVYLGHNVVVGDNTILHPGVKVYPNSRIGNNCIIHAGAVIGSDGFGFAPENGVYKKIPQMGIVIIEDDVEIGANTTIDRAVMDATIIHNGAKLDNLIQIAHNVEIGEHTAMAAQVGVSGSTKIGKHCVFGGQAGLGGHITIGDNSSIGAQAGVIGNVKPESAIIGSPPMPIKDFFRSSAVFSKLPDMYRELGQLQKELNALKLELGKKK